jgi:hypothetical protein
MNRLGALFCLGWAGWLLCGALPARAESIRAGEFIGTIIQVTYLDALVEDSERYELAVISVRNAAGQQLDFLVNRNTAIKSPTWGDGYLVYLQKGMRVKVEYTLINGEKYIAKAFYVKKE